MLRWRRVISVLTALLASACVAGTRAGAADPVGAASPEGVSALQDTSLFGAVLRALPRDSIYLLRVDPRPLNPDADLVFPHDGDLATVPESVTAARASIARQLGAASVDAVEGADCERGPGGLRRTPATARVDRRGIPRLFCVITELPRPGGAYFPRRGIDRRSSVPAGAFTTRAVVITASFTAVYDVVAVRDAERGWRVVDRAEVYRTWS